MCNGQHEGVKKYIWVSQFVCHNNIGINNSKINKCTLLLLLVEMVHIAIDKGNRMAVLVWITYRWQLMGQVHLPDNGTVLHRLHVAVRVRPLA